MSTTKKAPISAAPEATFVLPSRCKPSKALGDDVTRPILQQAYLKRRKDGLWLLASDSYIAIAIKVNGDAQEGWVPGGVLRQMERGKDAVQISETAWRVQTEPYASTTFDVASVAAGASFPDLEGVGLWETFEQSWNGDRVAIGLNPKFMARIGDSFGCGNAYGCRFEVAGPLRPVVVKPLRSDIEAVALQMPIRLNI